MEFLGGRKEQKAAASPRKSQNETTGTPIKAVERVPTLKQLISPGIHHLPSGIRLMKIKASPRDGMKKQYVSFRHPCGHNH
jgi:hypothetical protein